MLALEALEPPPGRPEDRRTEGRGLEDGPPGMEGPLPLRRLRRMVLDDSDREREL